MPCLGVWPLVPILDFKPVHMCWEQLSVGEWADCVLIVYLAIADDPRLVKMLSIFSLVLKKKGSRRRRSGWLNQLLLKVGVGG